jgi:hypothetical protein
VNLSRVTSSISSGMAPRRSRRSSTVGLNWPLPFRTRIATTGDKTQMNTVIATVWLDEDRTEWKYASRDELSADRRHDQDQPRGFMLRIIAAGSHPRRSGRK